MRKNITEDIREPKEIMDDSEWVKNFMSRIKQDPLKIDPEETEEILRKIHFDISG